MKNLRGSEYFPYPLYVHWLKGVGSCKYHYTGRCFVFKAMRFCPCDCSVSESNDIILYENGVQFLFINLSFSVSESHMDYIAHMYRFSCMFLSFPFPWFMQMVFLFLSFPFHISLASARCFSHLFDPDTAWEKTVESKPVLCVCVCLYEKQEHFLYLCLWWENKLQTHSPLFVG